MDDILNRPLNRRSFMSGGLAAAGTVAGAGGLLALLEACSTSSGSQSSTTTGAPKRGGTLTVGSLGNAKDTIDSQYGKSDMDAQRAVNLYDQLVYFDHRNQKMEYGAAQEISLSSDAQTATIRLRQGLTFHNGKTATADDLIFSLQRILDPNKPGSAHTNLASINPNALTKMDNLTVRAALNFPDAILAVRFYQPQIVLIPVGFDPQSPVGTGPFKLKTFTPGQRSDFVRNANYWFSGQPHLDELVIIDFADDTSRVNALVGGQIDALDRLPAAQVPVMQARSDIHVLSTACGYFQPIVMRVDQAPFTDVRVRQAFRLMVDRNQMVRQVYSGHGRIGNDMYCPYDPSYPSKLAQRHQDLDQAKSLLKAAGQSDMAITLTTSPEDPGLLESAQVFAQNAKAAGVTVTIDNIPSTQYDNGFGNWTFTQGYYSDKPFGEAFSITMVPNSIFWDSHWNDEKSLSLYKQALAETDTTKRNELFSQVQTILYDSGGYIIHSFRDQLDAYSKKFTGFVGDQSTGFALGMYRYREVSLA